MSVSKRLRYEILRRDNHTCRYCGGTAPDVALTVDHVLPVALGGTDAAGNLVAACSDCNSGKAAANPNDLLVDQVSEDAIRWARAVEQASRQASLAYAELQEIRGIFDSVWRSWMHGDRAAPRQVPRPVTWPDSIDRFVARGLPADVMEECVRIAMTQPSVRFEEKFTYFCGIAWNKVNQIDTVAREIYTAKGLEAGDAP